jgi:hypothetical protein
LILGATNRANDPTSLTSRRVPALTLTGKTARPVLALRVAGGAAPFTVNSTTRVRDLNADKLDGRHGSFYRNAGNIKTGTLNVARYNAYRDLSVSGRLDNTHPGDLLTRRQADGRYLMLPGCPDLVGSYLVTSWSDGRAVLTLFADGNAVFTDSVQNTVPYTEHRGTWRCDTATTFTARLVAFLTDKIGRIDLTGTLNPALGTLSGSGAGCDLQGGLSADLDAACDPESGGPINFGGDRITVP